MAVSTRINECNQFHRDCGGQVVSRLWASDADNDYYESFCLRCGKVLANTDVKLRIDPEDL